MTLTALENEVALAKPAEAQLKTVVVYSDHSAAGKAMVLKQRLLQQFTSGRPMLTAWWALESLKDKVLFNAACRHAADADLLFLALTVSDKLPPEIKMWLEAVFTNNSRTHPALVALLGATGKLPSNLNLLDGYLHEQARCAGVDYFIYWHRQNSSLAADCLAEHRQLQPVGHACAIATTNGSGVPRWGLNE
jgi:hypothetical protein